MTIDSMIREYKKYKHEANYLTAFKTNSDGFAFLYEDAVIASKIVNSKLLYSGDVPYTVIHEVHIENAINLLTENNYLVTKNHDIADIVTNIRPGDKVIVDRLKNGYFTGYSNGKIKLI